MNTLFIKYGTILAVLLGLILCYRLWQKENKALKAISILLLLSIALASYMRFVEPRLISIYKQTIDLSFITEDETPLKVVVIADPQLGPFKDASFMNKVVTEINQINPDLVLFPGDFFFKPEPQNVPELLAPFGQINAPMYAVSGNHDYDKDNLIELLKEHLPSNVILLNDKTKKIKIQGHDLTLIGLNDLWYGKPNNTLLEQTTSAENIIAIVHNPDHIHHFPNNNVDLTIAGHTHGGQIRLPWIYKHIIPSDYGYDWGYYDQETNTQLFITSGLGETALPMRFLRPPQIAVLTLE